MGRNFFRGSISGFAPPEKNKKTEGVGVETGERHRIRYGYQGIFSGESVLPGQAAGRRAEKKRLRGTKPMQAR